ncbi:rod shape-determining protein MreC [Patescibacteria group bacterium]
MYFFKGRTLIITLAVFLLLIFLHSLDILNPIERIIFKGLSPIQSYFYEVGVKTRSLIDRVKQNDNPEELELLKAQIRSLLVQNAKLKLLDVENKLLKEELKFNRRHSYELVSARVLGVDSIRLSSLLILELDNEIYNPEDIVKNMPIITGDGILIGKIADVKQGQIFMVPITAPQSAIAATVLNKDYTIGVAEGEFNIGIKMQMIPSSESLKQGGLVVTSGLEAEMPRGLLIGTISQVAHDPQKPFNIAHITPLFDQKRLTDVLIIKDY